MTEQEIKEFFEREGCYPAPVRIAPPKKSLSHSTTNARLASRPGWRLALKGWRAPLHWQVPPAFENSGVVYETLGHEAYCQQVREYYENLGQLGVEEAQRWHDRWAVRQFLRNFETHVRGFRGQSVGRNGSIFGRSSGQQKFGEGRRAVYQDIITLPEDLVKDGRLVADLGSILRAYGVHNSVAAERLVKIKLQRTWGIEVV